MTTPRPRPGKKAATQFPAKANQIEDNWSERVKEYINENRALSFVLFGLLALSLGILVDSTLALVVVTALLYLAIVFLNVELKNLQEKQNKIIEAERRPFVEIADVDFSTDPCEFRISNFGNGYATHLAVAMKTHIPAKTDIEPATTSVNITRANTEEFERYEGTVPPKHEAVQFEGTPQIGISDGVDKHSVKVEEAVERFLEDGVNRINYRIVLIYVNQLGEVGYRPLTSIRSTELERQMNFQEFQKHSVPLGGYERDTFPDFGLSDVIHTRDVDQLREPTLL